MHRRQGEIPRDGQLGKTCLTPCRAQTRSPAVVSCCSSSAAEATSQTAWICSSAGVCGAVSWCSALGGSAPGRWVHPPTPGICALLPVQGLQPHGCARGFTAVLVWGTRCPCHPVVSPPASQLLVPMCRGQILELVCEWSHHCCALGQKGPKPLPRRGYGEDGFNLGLPPCPAMLHWPAHLADGSDVATPQHTC